MVEAVFERPDVKATAYEEVEAAASGETVIATNTSSIPITELALTLRSPGRFLGVHWFVPPLLVPCVEVIPTRSTDPGVVENVVSALTALGKIAVVVGDGPGFVANRIQFAMFREAARIVEDGVATPEQVDEIVRSSFGFRLPFFGPFTIADMAGLDVYADDGEVAGLEQQRLGGDVVDVEGREQGLAGHQVAEARDVDTPIKQEVDQEGRRGGLEPPGAEVAILEQQQ